MLDVSSKGGERRRVLVGFAAKTCGYPASSSCVLLVWEQEGICEGKMYIKDS